jgi:hypothetical protein
MEAIHKRPSRAVTPFERILSIYLILCSDVDRVGRNNGRQKLENKLMIPKQNQDIKIS